jgi:polyhydroxyalkanoic acid synthase PhaR subunit
MAEDPVRDGKKFDPMEPWRGVRDVYMDAWGKTMVDMVNSEAYAQATGAVLDTYLTVSAPFREAVEKAMLKTLEQLAMPTRADVVSIAERMTNIEMRLDDLDAKLDGIQRLITQAAATPRPAQRTPPQPTKPQASKPQPSKKKTISAKTAVKRGKK